MQFGDFAFSQKDILNKNPQLKMSFFILLQVLQAMKMLSFYNELHLRIGARIQFVLPNITNLRRKNQEMKIFRVHLSKKVADTIASSFSLLGITVQERM